MGRIVVFGANGFIGSNLIAEMVKQPSNTIVAFDRFPEYKKGPDHPFSAYSNVEIVAGDFLNRNEIADVLQEGDYVFHLISTTNPATSNDDPYIDIDTNVRGSVELFELCVTKKVKKVVFLSSGGTVYGDVNSDKINELVLPEPRSPYGICKLAIEHYLRYFKYVSKLDYIVYRVANPYGVGQNIHGKQGAIPIFIRQVLAGEPVTVFGDGSMVRDYIYISDLVEMIAKTYSKPNHYAEYNIGGGGSGASVNDIIATIEKCSKQEISKTYVATPPTFVHKSVLDSSRFVAEFGVKPSVGLEDGIRRTWDYVKRIT